MTDWAASLTYYGVLALFPALIVLVSLVGFFADPATVTQALTDVVSQLGPASAVDTFAGPIQSVTSNQAAAGVLGIISIVIALSSASGYVGAFMRASNEIYETPEGRPFWKLKPLQMAVTLLIVLLAIIVVVALVVSGPLVDAIARAIGIGSTAATIYQIVKWPIIAAIVLLIFAVLYYSAPNVKQPKGFRWVTWGSAFALVVWVIASAAFAFYVANFGSYNATYGALGGVVVFLVWLWITNIAILLGAELNSELERGRELEAGERGAEEKLRMEPRDEPKEPRTA
jgi:membrane protein